MATEPEISPYWQTIIDAPMTEADRRNELIGNVEAGLKEYFFKRAGEGCAVRSEDGSIGVKLNGIYSLDEMMFHIVAAITGKTVEDLFGPATVVKF